MAARSTEDIAAKIREIDRDNTLPARCLGADLEAFLGGFVRNQGKIMAFVERTNPDKRMGAGRLAELIVAEFRLDEEER